VDSLLAQPQLMVCPLRRAPAATEDTFPQSQRHSQRWCSRCLKTTRRPYRFPVKSMKRALLSSRLRQPQLFTVPLVSRLVMTRCELPHSQRQSHSTLPYRRSPLSAITVSRPNFCPTRSTRLLTLSPPQWFPMLPARILRFARHDATPHGAGARRSAHTLSQEAHLSPSSLRHHEVTFDAASRGRGQHGRESTERPESTRTHMSDPGCLWRCGK